MTEILYTNSTMSTLSRDELGEIYAFAVELGKGAGKMLTDAAQLRIGGLVGTHVQKENAVDLVTETDESGFLKEFSLLHFRNTAKFLNAWRGVVRLQP